jgi:hypothetical protein
MEKIMAFSLDLAKKIKDISRPRETREDIVEYYQEKYPGQKTDKKGKVTYEWKSKLVSDLQGFTTAKDGGLMKKKDIARRFENRRDKFGNVKRWEDTPPGPKQREEYKALGEYLPPKPPDGIHVFGNICVRYQDQPCESRNISVTIEGDEMQLLLETFDMQIIVNKYMMIDVDDEEPTITECPCPPDRDDQEEEEKESEEEEEEEKEETEPAYFDECRCEFDIEPIEDETLSGILIPQKPTKPKPNKGAKTKTKYPQLFEQQEKEPRKLKTQEEIIAELDEWDKNRKKQEDNS